MAELPLYGLRYMTRFQCIGAACEDDCCTGWAMSVDEAHYQALAARMRQTPAEEAELAATVAVAAEPTRDRYALMVLQEGRRCAMLDEDRLCRIHKRYGESLLPNTCAVYPRAVGLVSGRVELSGNVSCPEVARLCLLADDALDLVPIDRQQIVRELIFHQQGKELYDACLDPLRGAMSGLLAAPGFPLAVRLFFIASLGERTRDWLHRGGAIDGRKLEAAISPLRRLEVLRRLQKDFSKIRTDNPFPMTVVHYVLTSRLERASRAFLRVADQVAASYGADMDDPTRLWIAHRKRAAALPAAVAARLERALSNYCRNFVVQEWFTKQPRLIDHIHSLAVRVAVLRFLLAGHPGVATDTDRTLVEVVYSFTRTVDHDEAVLRDVVQRMTDQRDDTLGHVAGLLKV